MKTAIKTTTPSEANTPITIFSVAISCMAPIIASTYVCLMVSQKMPAAATWRPAMIPNAPA